MCTSSGAVLLIKKVLGLTNALHHDEVVLHEGVDLSNGQVNQHTSDLGSQLLAAHLLHEWEDA